MRGIWEKYYSEASAIIYVVDSSDKDRINEAYYAYNAIFDNENDNNSNNSNNSNGSNGSNGSNASSIANKPIIIYANKQDLPVCMVYICICICVYIGV